MKISLKQRAFSTAVVVSFALLLLVLALLQYRWSNQISDATSLRLADSLEMSMVNWHLDFFRDFSQICLAMQVDEHGSQTDLNEYAKRFNEWKSVATYPDLVSNIYVVRPDTASTHKILRLNTSTQRFDVEPQPAKFSDLEDAMGKAAAAVWTDSTLAAGLERLKPTDRADPLARRFLPGGRLAAWRFDLDIPALVHPIAGTDVPASIETKDINWVVIELNDAVIRTRIMPDLSQRYFQGTNGLDYQVAVIEGDTNRRAIYTSDPGFGAQDLTDADGTLDLFGRVPKTGEDSPIHIFRKTSEKRGTAQAGAVSWFSLLQNGPDDQDWQLVVRHRAGGPLGAFVAEMRRRDLMISFGILFMLLISMVMLVITSARAQRLAKLQMDFVTAVSHELRTPLTVISSAADNIAHGVVEGKQQLTQYGSVIGGQARQLSGLVEQMLLFAATQEGRQRFSLQPLRVADIVDTALAATEGLIRAAQFSVEQDIEPGMPEVMGDPLALSQCLQNLITNALKYGGDRCWIGIRARTVQNGTGTKEIELSIADRGIGIPAADLPHIFEPFYRSELARTAQIHGTGLGLPLAKTIAEAMRGTITVTSVLDRGSTFTLHLPVAGTIDHAEPQMDSVVTT